MKYRDAMTRRKLDRNEVILIQVALEEHVRHCRQWSRKYNDLAAAGGNLTLPFQEATRLADAFMREVEQTGALASRIAGCDAIVIEDRCPEPVRTRRTKR